MMNRKTFEKFFKTEKQRQFDTDFFKDAENYEAWDEIDFESEEEISGEQTFLIKAEDMKFFAEGVLDKNPLMNDEEYAGNSPYGELVPHPLFITQIAFWCVGVKGRGNWVRTPGARNPGQDIELYEPFRVGETIHIKMRPHDRYIKRGKYYLKYKTDFYNQDNVKKATWIATLILPKTRADIRKFVEGKRGLEV
ncbi:MAG: MaoC family dehydratase [Candidatus Hydrogenedentota bacterium]|nr:MAG: MaoC family dehydratase [Candidatus Hydrogenedentota bacterium]